ncbi:hypothetical protein [Streptomyces platensis]|uniref:hypothetical protein n=1 Tax=Streptomyces platensis TaxID=58346 RepID=UPI0037B89853
MNLTALALTVLLRRPLPEVLRERIMEPLGASSGWSWHGYADSAVELDGGRWGADVESLLAEVSAAIEPLPAA